MIEFFLGPFLQWFSTAVNVLVTLAATLWYVTRTRNVFPEAIRKHIEPRRLLWYAIGFRVLNAIALTFGQYYIWSHDTFGKAFLHAALGPKVPVPFIQHWSWLFNNSFGYFVFYSWGRFWAEVVIALGVAWLFYLFLTGLGKYRDRFFEMQETKLGFICAFLASWPGIVVFIVFTFVSVVLVSVVRRIVWKELYTTLGAPFIVAMILTFVFAPIVFKSLNINLGV